MKILEGKKLPYELEHKVDKCMIHYDVDYSSGEPRVYDLAVEVDFCGIGIDITQALKIDWPLRLEKYRVLCEETYQEMIQNRKTEPEDFGGDAA